GTWDTSGQRFVASCYPSMGRSTSRSGLGAISERLLIELEHSSRRQAGGEARHCQLARVDPHPLMHSTIPECISDCLREQPSNWFHNPSSPLRLDFREVAAG